VWQSVLPQTFFQPRAGPEPGPPKLLSVAIPQNDKPYDLSEAGQVGRQARPLSKNGRVGPPSAAHERAPSSANRLAGSAELGPTNSSLEFSKAPAVLVLIICVWLCGHDPAQILKLSAAGFPAPQFNQERPRQGDNRPFAGPLVRPSVQQHFAPAFD